MKGSIGAHTSIRSWRAAGVTKKLTKSAKKHLVKALKIEQAREALNDQAHHGQQQTDMRPRLIKT